LNATTSAGALMFVATKKQKNIALIMILINIIAKRLLMEVALAQQVK
jgi:hypothetical protein